MYVLKKGLDKRIYHHKPISKSKMCIYVIISENTCKSLYILESGICYVNAHV